MDHLILPSTKDQAREFLRLALAEAAKFGEQPEPNVPDGWMLVRREWAPIMSEIDRRAEKMWDASQDFQVTIEGDLYQELEEAENLSGSATPTHEQEESQ